MRHLTPTPFPLVWVCKTPEDSVLPFCRSSMLAKPHQIALAVQQPWAELIVRGVKTLEIRSTSARVRGPIYIYASRKHSDLPDAPLAAKRFGIDASRLPTGVIVGEAELTESRPALPDDAAAACVRLELLVNRFAWRFERPNRFEEPLPVRFLPYGIWFYPFGRKTELEKNC